MVGKRLVFALMYFIIAISTNAQMTHEFNLICENNDSGNALDIAFDTEGRVYLANGPDGLRIYEYNYAELISNFHYPENDTLSTFWVENVGVNSGGKIFFCGTQNLGSGVNTIYKLFICEIINNSLIVVDEIGSNWEGKPNYFEDIAFGKDGVMFLSNSCFLHAYEFADSSFLSKAMLDIEMSSDINDIEIDENDIIYIAANNGLYACRFEESNFTILNKVLFEIEKSHPFNIAVGKSGLVYLANGEDGLRIYIFDGNEFINTAQIKTDRDNPTIDVGVGIDGTIFTLNYCSGLSAYKLNNKQLVKTAYASLNNCDYRELKIHDDLYLFVISNEGNLQVFEYMLAVDVEEEAENPLNYTVLTQNYPNPFNPNTTIKYSIPYKSNVTLKVYDVLGGEVATLVNKEQPKGKYEVEFSAMGGSGSEVNFSELTSGIYFYRLQVNPTANGIYSLRSRAGGSPGDRFLDSRDSEQGFVKTKKMLLLK